ncbi:WD40 repeat-like protein [Neoconidiobolus thromboides FSU 785]|nr:WD40 repeat-like protein [Neoconidiobolus thromboides FSU 785]
MSLNSEELNLLILNYLQESGFSHSAFTFQQESVVPSNTLNATTIKPGALVNLALKGLQYMEIEAHVDEDGYTTHCQAPFTLLGKHECELKSMVKNPKKKAKVRREIIKDMEEVESDSKFDNLDMEDKKEVDKVKDISKDILGLEKGKNTLNRNDKIITDEEPEEEGEVDKVSQSDGTDPRDKAYNVELESEATILNGHDSEVYLCAWNPMFPTHIATSSHDGSSRVWRLPAGSKSDKISSHFLAYTSVSDSKETSAMDWHPKGTMLAIGSYDGYLRQYTHSGWLRFTTEAHSSPILSVKYSPKGTYILTGGMDFTARLWESATGNQTQFFEWHDDAVTCVAWKDDVIFTTASLDGKLILGNVDKQNKVFEFEGHEEGVNSIEWDGTGTYLASGSDDKLVKLWNNNQKTPIKTLSGHEGSISQVKWGLAPIGPNNTRLLFSASDDKSVCVWDVLNGTMLYRFLDHSCRISAIAISPDSKFLASCALDSNVHVYNTSDGKKVKTYFRLGDLFDIKWCPNGHSVAGCFADSSVALFDATF